MPKLWKDTIEAHRRTVRDATLDTAAALVAEHGLSSVTMSQIAERTGIGRATLYKYFRDVEAILLAWHEREVTRHFEDLSRVRDQAGDAVERLEGVLETCALICHRHHGSELAALLHRGAHVADAQRRLRTFIQDLLTEGAETGIIRDDVPTDELADYCLHALAAASALPSEAAVRRLVTVTLTGLRRRADGTTSATSSRAKRTAAHPSTTPPSERSDSAKSSTLRKPEATGRVSRLPRRLASRAKDDTDGRAGAAGAARGT